MKRSREAIMAFLDKYKPPFNPQPGSQRKLPPSLLRLLKTDIDSTVYRGSKLTADRLACERLEKQLKEETAKSDALVQEVATQSKQYAELSEEFKQLQDKKSQEIDIVSDKCLALERHIQNESLLGEQRQNEIGQLTQENQSLKDSRSELKQRLFNLAEQSSQKDSLITEYQKRIEKLESEVQEAIQQNQLQIQANPADLPFAVVPEIFGQKETEPKQNQFKKWLSWWIEPIITISFPKFLSGRNKDSVRF